MDDIYHTARRLLEIGNPTPEQWAQAKDILNCIIQLGTVKALLYQAIHSVIKHGWGEVKIIIRKGAIVSIQPAETWRIMEDQ